MDRNFNVNCSQCSDWVALRKESVDRNGRGDTMNIDVTESLSARRAWIEISMWCSVEKRLAVALRKESVDRNAV